MGDTERFLLPDFYHISMSLSGIKTTSNDQTLKVDGFQTYQKYHPERYKHFSPETVFYSASVTKMLIKVLLVTIIHNYIHMLYTYMLYTIRGK